MSQTHSIASILAVLVLPACLSSPAIPNDCPVPVTVTASVPAGAATSRPAFGPEVAPRAAVVLGTTTAGEYTVRLLADAPLATGLNAIHAEVRTTASGTLVPDLAATIRAVLGTGPGRVGAPVTGPMAYVAATGLYGTGVVFQSPSAGSPGWSVTLTLARAGAAPVDAVFAGLAVTDAGAIATAAAGLSDYVLSFGYPAPPHVGTNPIVVTLHASTDRSLTFQPEDGAVMLVDASQPPQGTASTGNVHPVLTSSGIYGGSVNLTPAGTWAVTVRVCLTGSQILSPTFTTSF